MVIKLKDIHLFEGIDYDYINMIIDNSRRVNYSAWDVVIKQWDKSDGSAYIIQGWEVSVKIDDKEVNKLNDGSIFWEIALITNEPRTASAVAVTDLILLRIDKELLHTIIKKFKNWKDIQAVLMKRILENNKSSK